jgi:hypothetical protein
VRIGSDVPSPVAMIAIASNLVNDPRSQGSSPCRGIFVKLGTRDCFYQRQIQTHRPGTTPDSMAGGRWRGELARLYRERTARMGIVARRGRVGWLGIVNLSSNYRLNALARPLHGFVKGHLPILWVSNSNAGRLLRGQGRP